MASFIYFIDGLQTAPSKEQLQEHKLAHVDCAGGGKCSTGPGDQPGFCFVRKQSGDTRPAFYADKQTWHKVPNSPGGYVGYYNDSPPGPADVQRDDLCDGHEVEMGDGKLWTIPMAISWIEVDGEIGWFNRLPKSVSINETGDWCHGDVITKYQALYAAAQTWFEQWRQTELATEGEVSFDQENDCCMTALQVNYLLSPFECVVVLGMLDRDTKGKLLDSLIDIKGWVELIKKKAPDGLSTTVGEEDSIQATEPLLQTT